MQLAISSAPHISLVCCGKEGKLSAHFVRPLIHGRHTHLDRYNFIMASEPPLPAHTCHALPEDSESEDPFRSILLEHPNLPNFLDHSKETKYWSKPWEGSIKTLNISGLNVLLGGHVSIPKEGGIMIEEIGRKAVIALKRTFPGLDLHFLHQHVARSEGLQQGQLSIAHDVRSHPLSFSEGEPGHSASGMHFDAHYLPQQPSVLGTMSQQAVQMWRCRS